jgi:hypothetical protein
MKKSFITDINEINKNILEAEKMLKESMSFCEDETIEDVEMDEEPVETEMEPAMTDETPVAVNNTVDSYIDHIRKYTLNGLAALCDNPESEEYQMLKKIFQMCDKKAEKKDTVTESHRLFGIMKENKEVVFETYISDTKNFKSLKASLVQEAINRGINPASVRLVSENKIIR